MKDRNLIDIINQLLVYVEKFKIIGENINTINKTDSLLVTLREVVLEANKEKIKFHILSQKCRKKLEFTEW